MQRPDGQSDVQLQHDFDLLVHVLAPLLPGELRVRKGGEGAPIPFVEH